MSETWKLSPSDLTFLWDECPRCFYLKIVRKFNRPSTAFPAIFSRIDSLMKTHFEGKPTSEFTPDLPPGRVRFASKWVESQPIDIPGTQSRVYLRGMFDTVVEFDDGSFGVIDFKTSQPKKEHVAFYGRQLGAYAYALEHPAPGKLELKPVTHLGLLVVAPSDIERTPAGHIAYIGHVTWMECPLDEPGFTGFLAQVAQVLDLPEPPEPNPNCGFCQYRQAARESGL